MLKREDKEMTLGELQDNITSAALWTGMRVNGLRAVIVDSAAEAEKLWTEVEILKDYLLGDAEILKEDVADKVRVLFGHVQQAHGALVETLDGTEFRRS